MTEPSGLHTTPGENGELLVELNRPEKRNALDENLQGELLDVFQAAAVDGEVRGIILTGSGEAFSAGGTSPGSSGTGTRPSSARRATS